MKAIRISTMVLALSALALPAHAAVVGLLGGDFDPAPISDPSVFSFGACNNETGPSVGLERFENFRCIFYDFPTLDEIPGLDPISSIEFFLFGLNTAGLTVDNGDGAPNYLQFLTSGETLVPGAFRLSGGLISPNFCNVTLEFAIESVCTPITGLALFVGPDGDETLPQNISAQVVAVNDTITAVPEPATLLMLGPGVVGALIARRRMRRHTNA